MRARTKASVLAYGSSEIVESEVACGGLVAASDSTAGTQRNTPATKPPHHWPNKRNAANLTHGHQNHYRRKSVIIFQKL